MLKLVFPDKKYLPSVYEAVKEYKKHPSKFEIHTVSRMIAATENDFVDYFENIMNDHLGINLKPNYVADTVYWLIDDEKYIGTFDLRHALTPSLEQIGGHIAYQIRPDAQRKGYASKGLELCLKKAKDINIEKVLVTCNAENAASYGVMHKVMLKNGGYEDTVFKKDDLIERRVWINCVA